MQACHLGTQQSPWPGAACRSPGEGTFADFGPCLGGQEEEVVVWVRNGESSEEEDEDDEDDDDERGM